MCQLHNRISGKDAVVQLTLAKMFDDACARRLAYLEKQVGSFKVWLDKQDWCKDAEVYCAIVIAQTEKEFDRDANTCADYLFDSKEATKMEQMELEFDDFEQLVERIDKQAAMKQYSKAEMVRQWEEHLERWKTELKLHDEIQDRLDTFKPTDYLEVKALLDGYKKEKKLRYGGWAIFMDQVRANMRWKPMKKNYKVICVADQVAKAERKLAELNKEIQEKEEFFSDPHEEADEWLEKKEQQVFVAGLIEMQQSYICPMCGAESFPGHKGCSCS